MATRMLLVACLAAGSALCVTAAEYPDPCDDPIYCVGGEESLLHVVQMAELFKDSKTFVDMPTKFPEATVLANFRALMDVS